MENVWDFEGGFQCGSYLGPKETMSIVRPLVWTFESSSCAFSRFACFDDRTMQGRVSEYPSFAIALHVVKTAIVLVRLSLPLCSLLSYVS